MITKRRSITNLVAEIQTQAMIISQAKVETVIVNYDGARDLLYVAIGESWSVYVPLQHDEVQCQLNVIRNRLGRLMDRLPEPGEVAA